MPNQTETTKTNNPTETVEQISTIELDALKEVANIGTGNASIAISNIFKKRVDITLPKITLSTPKEVATFIAGPKEMIVGIYSKITSGIEGNIIMMMPITSALDITSAFIKNNEEGSKHTLLDKDKAVLQKIGMAIYSSYLTSLAKFFEKKITFEPPTIISTYGESILDFILLHVNSEKVLVIKLGFSIENTKIKGDFVLLFTTDSLQGLLKNVRKKM